VFQFLDLNEEVNAFQRDFAQEVRRCEEMERKLRFISDEIARAKITAIAKESQKETMTSLERNIEEREAELRELNQQFEALINEKNRTREHLEVLSRNLGWARDGSSGLTMICGVMPKDKQPLFERLLFRATRGNSILFFDPIPEPFFNTTTNDTVEKVVFSVMFSANRLQDKIRKMVDANSASVYSYAENREQLVLMRQSLKMQLDSLSQTLQQTANRRHQLLQAIAGVLQEWRRTVLTEKAVMSTLNLVKYSGSTAIARGWCPSGDVERVKDSIREAEFTSGAQVATVVQEIRTKEKRPTFFRTNKFTSSFQGIVDSYGIARYKEVNPGVFTIVTFPYLFGIMYGDIGHGLMLTVFAALLIFFEKNFEGKQLNEIFAMIFGGRYLLFLMGLFAVYVGLLYNDMFGFSTELFQSGYKWKPLPPDGPVGITYPTDPAGLAPPSNPVAFGIDSAWAETDNKLEFYNSIKMKCAVIIGIVQMMAGVFLSLMNHVYFNDWLHVYFRFIPEIVFLSCTFGYMALLIVVKWCTVWTDPSKAPSLLETMTNFFLQPGTVTLQLYPGQTGIQVFLLLVAFAMVPILLCVIPYMEKKHHDEKVAEKLRHPIVGDGGDDDDDDDHFDFSEVCIHQIIHTIEYVLGCVSNTASYLRLWALSLAHAQLSDVVWNFAFMMTVGLDSGNGVFVFLGFAVWMQATIGVLLGMESLSAFLHSLRLHWVEFQNKFYYGDGLAFTPFDLPSILGDPQH
jgi:V-type H+-transporting ATPase subunit a